MMWRLQTMPHLTTSFSSPTTLSKISILLFLLLPVPSVSGFLQHHVFVEVRPLVGLCMARRLDVSSPPLTDPKTLSLSWKQVAEQAAAGVKAAYSDGNRRVSVDIPQISSVDRSTTARKYEDDNNFLLNLVGMLGAPKNPTPVGKDIQILDGGFEKGGDYLSDEGLYGFTWEARNVGQVIAIGNSEIDASALKDLNKLDNGSSRILLFNCNPDRLSFFDKLMGMPDLSDVETAYLLKRIGPGFIGRKYPQDYAVWKLSGGKPVLAAVQPTRFEGSQANKALQ